MRFLIPVILIPLIFFCMASVIVIMPASAHAPLAAGENRNLAGATLIPDPLKSYVVYSHLHEPGEAAYFRMEMARGDRLVLALNVNRAGAPIPDLLVIGPGITSSGTAPSSIEVPPGSGVMVIRGTAPRKAEYEAFAPSVIYEVASYTTIISEPGTYYALVSSPAGEIDYSFVVGYREEFTGTEWLVTPLSLIGIYLWEGQPPWSVAAPYGIVILVCIGILAWQEKRAGAGRKIQAWAASLAGVLYIATGASTLNQMFWVFSLTGYSPESSITLIFAAIPILLGAWALRAGGPALPVTPGMRVSLAIIGGLGFVIWAGLIIGPVLALMAAILPEGSERLRRDPRTP